jgi:hypothetical protein
MQPCIQVRTTRLCLQTLTKKLALFGILWAGNLACRRLLGGAVAQADSLRDPLSALRVAQVQSWKWDCLVKMDCGKFAQPNHLYFLSAFIGVNPRSNSVV